VDDESGSKMDIKNLSTVIAPNILYLNAKTATLDSDPMYAIEAVEMLITHIEEMCLVRTRTRNFEDREFSPAKLYTRFLTISPTFLMILRSSVPTARLQPRRS
jgi:hypothetical protein